VLSKLIADALEASAGEANLKRVATEVMKLCDRFPVYA
jgi:glycine/serine hydroxymethyltransferase